MIGPRAVPEAIQNIVQQAISVSAMVDHISYVQLYGTRSQRRPDLGKMKRCVFCGYRKVQGDKLPCCTASYSKVAHDKNDKPVTMPRPKGRLHRHRNAKRLQLHEMTLRFQNDEAAFRAAFEFLYGRVMTEADLKKWPPVNRLMFASAFQKWAMSAKPASQWRQKRTRERANANPISS